jgi:hypothetical protein
LILLEALLFPYNYYSEKIVGTNVKGKLQRILLNEKWRRDIELIC